MKNVDSISPIAIREVGCILFKNVYKNNCFPKTKFVSAITNRRIYRLKNVDFSPKLFKRSNVEHGTAQLATCVVKIRIRRVQARYLMYSVLLFFHDASSFFIRFVFGAKKSFFFQKRDA